MSSKSAKQAAPPPMAPAPKPDPVRAPEIRPAGATLEQLRAGGLRGLIEAVASANGCNLIRLAEALRIGNQIPSGPMMNHFDPSIPVTRADTVDRMLDQAAALAVVSAAYGEALTLVANS